jgi:dCTP diphosphatase
MADKTDQTETVGGLRDLMRGFVKERDWEKYHTPRNLAASVSVEAGELLELFQWLTPEEAIRKSKDDKDFRQAVGEELADVLMYLMSLANALDLDVASTVHEKMRKNRLKYPADQFQGHYERPIKARADKI